MAEGLLDRLALVEPGGETLVLRRAWPRGRRHLLLEYRGAGGELVAGQWLADPGELERVAEETAAAGEVALAGREGSRVLLQRDGADRRLRPLRRLVATPGAALVSHRPERRALVRLDGDRHAKVVRPERAARILTALRAAAEIAGERFDVPAVVEADPAAGVIVTSGLRGRPLHERLEPAAAGAVGRALSDLHSSPAPDALPVHGPAEEAAVVAEWVDHAKAYAPALAAALDAALPGVRAALASLQPPRLVPVHRDLHDKQCLIGAEGRVGLLDFDTLARGDAALDLANLLVHVELRALQAGCAPERAEAVGSALVDGYEPAPDVAGRIAAYAGATRLRLACVYAFRPRWSELPGALLSSLPSG